MKAILKVHRKGIIVLPKKIRSAVSIEEGGSLIAEVKDSMIILRPFLPKRVRLGGRISEIVKSNKLEEIELEA